MGAARLEGGAVVPRFPIPDWTWLERGQSFGGVPGSESQPDGSSPYPAAYARER